MSQKMYAIFSDDSYKDLMSGAAVDNNGLRSPNGCYYPDQPSFEPINERKEQLQDAGVQILIAAVGCVVFKILLPEAQRFAHEKVYPFVTEKWDRWQENLSKKESEKHISKSEDNTDETNITNDSGGSSNCRIIDIEEYRKMA